MLRVVLLANALSCVVFGVLFALDPAKTSAFIGDPPILLIQILGIGLVGNSVALVWSAFFGLGSRNVVVSFALGDGAWVLATFVLLFSNLWITTDAGIAWSLGVSVFVGFCGLAQYRLAPMA